MSRWLGWRAAGARGRGGAGKGSPGSDPWGVALPSGFVWRWLDVTSLPFFLVSARKSRFLLPAPGQLPGKAGAFGNLSGWSWRTLPGRRAGPGQVFKRRPLSLAAAAQS